MRSLSPEEAAKLLKQGGVVLLPASTLWGISADGTSSHAKKRVLEIKRRDDLKFVHLVSSLEMAKEYGVMNPCALSLAQSFWPGPLTLVVKATDKGLLMAAPQGTVALRLDPHPVAMKVVDLLERPVLSTSANIHGTPAPLTFSDIDPKIVELTDGFVPGKEPAGVPSTVVDCTGESPLVLRKGALSLEEDELCS